MGPFQRYCLTVLSIACLLAVLIAVFQNWATPARLVWAQWVWTGVPMGAVILGSFLLGIAGVFFRFWELSRLMRAELKQYELRREKAEVRAESTHDQVRALESKIQTLEKALSQALKQDR